MTNPLKYKSSRTNRDVHKLVLLSIFLTLTYSVLYYVGNYFFATPTSRSDLNYDNFCFSEFHVKLAYTVVTQICVFIFPFLLLITFNAAFFCNLTKRLHFHSKTKQSNILPKTTVTIIRFDRVATDDMKEVVITSAQRCNKNPGPAESVIDKRVIPSISFNSTPSKKAGVSFLHDKAPSRGKVTYPYSNDSSKYRASHFLWTGISREGKSSCEISMDPINIQCKNKSEQQRSSMSFPPGRMTENARLRRIATKLMTYVMIFLICWFPFALTRCLTLLGFPVPALILQITTPMLLANSIINPLLYAVFQRRYRKFFSKLIRG